MYLLSTAKTTVLTDFNDLEIKSIYQHSNGENTDFQFYGQQRVFVEVNKKSGLEIMRVKEKAQKFDIQRVRKLNLENVYCVACSKQTDQEMAVGLTNGQVRLYNYKKSEFVHKFSADSNRNSVIFMDYNLSDEYIAAVYENGSINVYGHRTKTKTDTFNVDGCSTLARFHPAKRFALSIASYKGAVTIYDVHSKRKVFHAVDAHAAECRDLCISPTNPDTLISVGYDCVVNIYDTRRKVKPIQEVYNTPLSTVAISECGKYFCVGDLKGDLTTHDIRNTKTYLATKNVHGPKNGVIRVAFAPQAPDSSVSFSSSGVGGETSTMTPVASGSSSGGSTDLRKSIASNLLAASEGTRPHRDSFCDFLDFQANRGQEKISPRFAPRRDSFDWDMLSRKPSTDESRKSFIGVGGTSGIGSNISATQNDSFDVKLNSSDILKGPLRDRSNTPQTTPVMVGKLTQILEEDKALQESLQNSNQNSITTDSDKENPQIDLDFVQSRLLKQLPNDYNSTPLCGRTSMEGILATSKPPSTASSQSTSSTSSNSNTIPKIITPCTTDVHQAISELRSEMSQRFNQLEFEMKFLAEKNKWQLFTQNFNLWNQSSEQTEEIRDCLGILLQTDPFVNEFLRLKEENELLKSQLQQFIKE